MWDDVKFWFSMIDKGTRMILAAVAWLAVVVGVGALILIFFFGRG